MKSCITVSEALHLFKKQHDDYIPKYTVGFPQALSFALLVFVQRIPHPTLRRSIPLAHHSVSHNGIYEKKLINFISLMRASVLTFNSGRKQPKGIKIFLPYFQRFLPMIFWLDCLRPRQEQNIRVE